MSAAKCLETHGHVDLADDDLEFVEKLASNLGLSLRIGYANKAGEHSIRTIEIDGVFGEHILAPRYLRAVDSESGERRTFDIHSIVGLVMPNRAVATTNVPFYVAALIRQQLGLGLLRLPLSYSEPAQLVVEVIDAGSATSVSGELKAFTLEHRRYGSRSYLTIKPDQPFNGSRRPIKMDMLPNVTGYDMKTAGSISCGQTGEVIADLYSWVAAHLELNSNGWPLPDFSDDR